MDTFKAVPGELLERTRGAGDARATPVFFCRNAL